MSNPLVSVVMPVYNGEKYLKEAIDSILNQTFTNFEFIILNDGSTDRTEDIILSYNDSRIHYVKNDSNLQIVKTLNKGIELALGKYIARMDADDISLPQRFEKQIKFMEDNLEIDACGTWFKTLGDRSYIQKLPINHERIKSDLLFYTPIAHPTLFAKRCIFATQKYSDKFPQAEDYALWVNIIHKYQFSNIPEPLLMYRLHSQQSSSANVVLQQESTYKAALLMLNKLNHNFSTTSLEYHRCLILHSTISLSKTEEWLKSLVVQNQKINLFDENSLSVTIFNIWRSQTLINTSNGFRNWKKFYFSPLYLPKQLSIIEHIKFTVKCIIHHQKYPKKTEVEHE